MSYSIVLLGESNTGLFIGCLRKKIVKFQSKTITCRNYANYNPKVFCDELKSVNFEVVLSKACINQAWLQVNEILTFYINMHAPLTK